MVLLTPVVLVTAARLRASPRAPAYACVHLANSASLLLPVSNLTNLLAFRAAGVSFARFGLLMLLPTAWAVAVDWAALRRLTPTGDAAAAATDPVDPVASVASVASVAPVAPRRARRARARRTRARGARARRGQGRGGR